MTLIKKELPSERSFGLLFAAVCGAMVVLSVAKGHPVKPWSVVLGLAFLGSALAVPRVLRPLNVAWYYLGLALHAVMTPLLMGGAFCAIIVPMSVWLRLRGRDPLRLKWDRDASSYWIERMPRGPDPRTMIKQF